MLELTKEDVLRLESKLDKILAAMGLSDNRRLAPIEAQQIAKNIVVQFRKKQKNEARNDRKAS